MLSANEDVYMHLNKTVNYPHAVEVTRGFHTAHSPLSASEPVDSAGKLA